MIWNLLPLDDIVIARVLGLESTEKVINLRMVAKNHLAKVLIDPGIPKKEGRASNMGSRGTPSGSGGEYVDHSH